MATCGKCGAGVLHVKDDYTDATFPVDEIPSRLRGYKLTSPKEGERSSRAVLVDEEVYKPHSASCRPKEAGHEHG